jgi:hypothetical protein
MKETITELVVEDDYSLFDKLLAEEAYVTIARAPAVIEDQESMAVTEPHRSEIERDFDRIDAELKLELKRDNEYREQVRAAHRRLFEELEGQSFEPLDRRDPVPVDSLESHVGYTSLVRLLHDDYTRSVAFYRSKSEAWSLPEEARAKAFHRAENEDEAWKLFDEIMKYPLHQISLENLHLLHGLAPRVAEYLWEDIKAEGRSEFESGHLAARTMLPTGYMKRAWDVARYLGVRESFIDEWQPRGGIELSMIDMIAQSFFQNQYWMEQMILRSQTKPREEHPDYIKWKSWQPELGNEKSWETGYWFPHYVHEQEAIEYAAKMADRFNRIYLRTLRQLRDLRRYSPVTINNPSQVNIASDGGQQINVAKSMEEDPKQIIN